MLSVHDYLSRQASKLGGDIDFLLSMADGKVICSSITNPQKSSRQSAMSSALLALSESFSKEALGEENKELTISCNTGHAVIIRTNENNQVILLCLTSSDKTNLALLLRLARDTASKIKFK